MEFRRIRSVLARNCSTGRPQVLIIVTPEGMATAKVSNYKERGWDWESKVSNSKMSIGREGEKYPAAEENLDNCARYGAL